MKTKKNGIIWMKKIVASVPAEMLTDAFYSEVIKPVVEEECTTTAMDADGKSNPWNERILDSDRYDRGIEEIDEIFKERDVSNWGDPV